MANEERSKLNGTTHCRCGAKWGEHKTEFDFNRMLDGCCICCGYIGESLERYRDRGNYCPKCNSASERNWRNNPCTFAELIENL